MIKLIKDKKYPNMYRLQWPDGTISISTPHPDRKGGHYGFYSKTRAKELIVMFSEKKMTIGRSYMHPLARINDRTFV